MNPTATVPRLLKVSTANTAYQRLDVLLRNRTKRHRYGEFVVEGVRAINSALAAGWTIRSFVVPRDRQLSQWARSILETSTADTHLEMAPELFETISGKDEPSELIAVAAIKPDSTERIAVKPGMVVVVVDRPASPGNLGTLIRSCDAFGVSGVIVSGHGVDLYDPATVRASVGSFFSVPCIALPSHRELGEWVSDVRRSLPALTVVGTSARGSVELRDQDWTREVVLLVGNETAGLSHAYREMCDVMATIPMRGTATSLNAAVAASIVLYEVDAQRRGRHSERLCHPERSEGSSSSRHSLSS